MLYLTNASGASQSNLTDPTPVPRGTTNTTNLLSTANAGNLPKDKY